MKPICRREFLAHHKLQYNESMRVSEDFAFLAESLFNGAKIILIQEAFYIYSMPSSPSGRSPHSRTVYQCDSVIEESDRLRRKYGDCIDPPLKRAMDKFRKTMTLLKEFRRRANLSKERPIPPICRPYCQKARTRVASICPRRDEDRKTNGWAQFYGLGAVRRSMGTRPGGASTARALAQGRRASPVWVLVPIDRMAPRRNYNQAARKGIVAPGRNSGVIARCIFQ